MLPKGHDVVPKPDQHVMPDIVPTCFDYAPFLSKRSKDEPDLEDLPPAQQLKESKQVELLMGGAKGAVIVYDPALMEKGKVIRFNP